MPGPYNTLLQKLANDPSLAGVSVAFGEENINAQEVPYPFVCIVPMSGPWDQPGYAQAFSVDNNMLWLTRENIDLYMGAIAPDPLATTADHADAVNDLRTLVLRALQNQAPSAFYYVPISGRWVTVQNASVRYGRSYVMTVRVDITVTDVDPVDATVTEITLNPTFVS